MGFTASYWIEKLALQEHVEGGAYRRTYEATLKLPVTVLPNHFKGDRPVATAIYFLLQQHQVSALHRIASDELWHFYYGDSLLIYEILSSGKLKVHQLGNNPDSGDSLQCTISAGSWFGSKVKEGGSYTLAGCTVSPGFDFADFELADRLQLINQYPQHEEIIEMLTHQ